MWVDECAQYADHLYDGRCISYANRPFSVEFISGIVLLSVAFFSAHFHRISTGQFTESKRKGQATSFYLLLLLLWRCSNGVLNGYLFSRRDGMPIAASCLMMLGIGLFICRFYFHKI